MNTFFSFPANQSEALNEELHLFAQSVADMDEGFLILDDLGTIILCNEPLQRTFALPVSPVGRFFRDVFEKAVVPGAAHPDRTFFDFLQKKPPASAELFLPSPSGKSGGETDARYALSLPYRWGDQSFSLYLLKKTSLPRNRMLGERENILVERNCDLIRANSLLRIENVERETIILALRRSEARYRSIFDNAALGIFQWTLDWRLLSANNAFARMMGYHTVNDLLFTVAGGPFHFCYSPAVEKELVTELERKGSIYNFELQMVRHNGPPLWSSLYARRVESPGGQTGCYEAFILNISQRKQMEERLLFQAFHDPLTGLANRKLFHDRLKMALRRVSRQSEYSFSVLYMDLDRFKIVNDSYGHHIGDDVLCHAALAIQSCVREVDTVARVGGDEFAVLIEENERKSFAVRVAQRIRNALCTPFDIRDQVINIGVSIGIVLKAERYELPEEILRDADIAMYKAKAECGIRCRVFNRKMRDESAISLFFEKDLLKGLESKEFFLDYQPMVHMDSGRLYGFEALVRWNRQGEILTPAYFLPIAEDTGNIGKLGLHIIEEVSRQMVEWKKQCSRSFAIHMNISGRQLHCPMFSREVRRILERTGVDPSCLFFEITEDVVLNSGGDCIRSIKRIRDLGVRFCLDNFGTGLSSLNYLRQLPLSCIKVDKSFILNVDTDPDSLVIVRNLLSLGQDLGLSVIAEGVEREQQVEALLSVGYALAQGYYFSYPLAVGKAGAFLSG